MLQCDLILWLKYNSYQLFDVIWQGQLDELLPTGSEEREVLGAGSIPVAILPSCQFMKNIAG